MVGSGWWVVGGRWWVVGFGCCVVDADVWQVRDRCGTGAGQVTLHMVIDLIKKPDRDFGPFRDGQSLPTALHVHRHQECRSRFVTHTAVHNVLDERGVSDEWEVAHGIAQTDGGWQGEARRGEARRGRAGRGEAR